MQNPFFYGRAVEGGAFINRKEEIRMLASDLERGQSVILFSPRRYGKTSLIKQVIKQLKRKKILCFYIDLYPITSLDKFYDHYAAAIAANLNTPVNALVNTLHSLLPAIRPKLIYSEPGMPSVQIEANLSTLKSSKTLRQLFDCADHYCKKHKIRGAVIFDEFQEIVSLEEGDVLEREMRSAFQHHQHVSYAFLGSKMHLMNELFKDKNRPFFNFGARYELKSISEKEWIPYIQKKFNQGGYVVSEEALRLLTEITSGHPYYTQLLCSEIWESCREEKEVTGEKLEQILQEALCKENHAFQELWDSLSRLQRKVVHTLAQEPDAALFSAENARKYSLGAQSTTHRTVEQLLKKGVLIKEKGKYALTDPFIGKWLTSL